MQTAPAPRQITAGDGELYYFPAAFSPEENVELLASLQEQINWTQRSLNMFGKTVTMPRLLAWYAAPGIQYAYSGGTSPHNNWTETLLRIKARVESLTQATFNGALLNLYRNGQDSMGWHSDNEPSLGKNPIIASASFGAARHFHLRHRQKSYAPIKLLLEPGSLLLMSGALQHHWQHQLPKTRQTIGPRINITFRNIIS